MHKALGRVAAATVVAAFALLPLAGTASALAPTTPSTPTSRTLASEPRECLIYKGKLYCRIQA
ncbi:hypothetical protein [Streptomyces sp. NPDC005953]|uniref:hypothetical protein n=1 Tax=unclassified Streptomyces TaxID=2593676 RepID=UPI0033F9E48C